MECDVTSTESAAKDANNRCFVVVVLTKCLSPAQRPILSGSMEQGTPKQPKALEKGGKGCSTAADGWAPSSRQEDVCALTSCKLPHSTPSSPDTIRLCAGPGAERSPRGYSCHSCGLASQEWHDIFHPAGEAWVRGGPKDGDSPVAQGWPLVSNRELPSDFRQGVSREYQQGCAMPASLSSDAWKLS